MIQILKEVLKLDSKPDHGAEFSFVCLILPLSGGEGQSIIDYEDFNWLKHLVLSLKLCNHQSLSETRCVSIKVSI